MTQEFEFKSGSVNNSTNDVHIEGRGWVTIDKVEEICNEWAKEGWEVFSVICPDPRNYSTFRLTAKRRLKTETSGLFHTATGRKFK